MKRHSWSRYFPFILSAGLVAAWLIVWLTPQADIHWFANWTQSARIYGYLNLRDYSSFNYLPGFLPILWLSNLGEGFLQLVGFRPQFANWWPSYIFVWQLVFTVWLLALMQPYLTERGWWRFGLLLLFLPFFVWVMWVWGQVDLLVVLPWLISLVYLVQRRPVLFLLFSLFAILLKPTGILFVPLQLLLFAITYLRDSLWKDWLKYGTAVLVTLLIVIAPFIPFLVDWLTHRAAWQQQTALTYNAYNLWFALQLPHTAQTLWHGLSYQLWGGLLLALIMLPLTHILFRVSQHKLTDRQLLLLYVSYAFVYAYSFVMLLTDMHERYWDFALGPLIITAALHKPWRPVLIVLAVTTFINLVLIFPSDIQLFQSWQRHWIELGAILSWIHLLLFPVIVFIWIKLEDRLVKSK